MTQQSIFEPEGRAVPFVVEGEGPVSLVLVTVRDLESDGLGVVAHYLAEEAGFHVIRVGLQAEGADAATAAEQIDDVLALIDDLGLDDTWIGGHGFGGTVARAFAATHTDRVNGLLLLGAEDDDAPLAPAIPVLIVQGSEDTVTPPTNGERLQATAPERASVKNLEGADHFFPVTHPIETAVIIEEYLDWD
ncbi:alpha/beta fold hydrolase [Microbacterium sp.]|uniref:alpha/beta fold hydrolase n=1 Tax=Microbacterium sp. TaxID=51671 RepID=UPI002B8B0EE4|nr:alpha/beta fold hydrolase [Microbacterium sp.]HWK77137.1 alpha/beta fold hydrolase [Microbacterium sp.]